MAASLASVPELPKNERTGPSMGTIAPISSARSDLRLVVEVGARLVQELLGLVDDGRHDVGMGMPGRVDRDARGAVEEPVAVDVLDDGTRATRHHERIRARVGRRDRRRCRASMIACARGPGNGVLISGIHGASARTSHDRRYFRFQRVPAGGVLEQDAAGLEILRGCGRPSAKSRRRRAPARSADQLLDLLDGHGRRGVLGPAQRDDARAPGRTASNALADQRRRRPRPRCPASIAALTRAHADRTSTPEAPGTLTSAASMRAELARARRPRARSTSGARRAARDARRAAPGSRIRRVSASSACSRLSHENRSCLR